MNSNIHVVELVAFLWQKEKFQPPVHKQIWPILLFDVRRLGLKWTLDFWLKFILQFSLRSQMMRLNEGSTDSKS